MKPNEKDEALLRAAQTGEGLITLTPDLMNRMRDVLNERTREFQDDLPKLVEACPYYMRLAVTAHVIEQVVKVAQEGGSFRNFIYDLLGFEPDAYVPLYLAGGMTITNEFVISEACEEQDAEIYHTILELANELDHRLDEGAPNKRRSFLLDIGLRVHELSKALQNEQEKRRRVEGELAAMQ